MVQEIKLPLLHITRLQNNKTAHDPEFTVNEPFQAVRLYKPKPIYTPATTVLHLFPHHCDLNATELVIYLNKKLRL